MGRDNFVPAKPGGRMPTPDILGQVLASDPERAEAIEIRETLTWDYDQLGSEKTAAIEHTVAIKKSERRASEAIITAGEHLIAMKNMLNHGQWGEWLAAEFAMSERTAQNMMAVAEKFSGKSANFALLKPSVLYMLAADNVPEEAREQVIQESQQARPTIRRTREVIEQYQRPPGQPTAADIVARRREVFNTPRPEGWPTAADIVNRPQPEVGGADWKADITHLLPPDARAKGFTAWQRGAFAGWQSPDFTHVAGGKKTVDDVISEVTRCAAMPQYQVVEQEPEPVPAWLDQEPETEELVHPLDSYTGDVPKENVKRINKMFNLKRLFVEARGKLDEFGDLTGRHTLTLAANRDLTNLIDVLTSEMEALAKGGDAVEENENQ